MAAHDQSKGVDVLAVLDQAVRFQAYGDDVQAAREAVAELIEAAKPAAGIVMGSLTTAEMTRLRAALARCNAEAN